MNIRFLLDADTGLPHVSNHGVTKREVREVFHNRGEVHPGTDASLMIIGPTDAGRVLKIIYKREPIPDSVFVITGYDLRGKALRAFRRRRRRKPR